MSTSYRPNLRVLELCISYRCNVRCPNCSNLCTQAPCGTLDMTIEDIEAFVRDSVDNNYQWGQISVHGGEPIIHPDIIPICTMLQTYRKRHNPGMAMQVLTNWSTPAIQALGQVIRGIGINLGVSEKHNDTRIPYVPVNESPLDLGEAYDSGCFQTVTCGICLNKDGYWPCSPMAAAARVFKYVTAIHSVNEINESVLVDMLQRHCRHCGFSMPGRRRVTEQTQTPTWARALHDYACA